MRLRSAIVLLLSYAFGCDASYGEFLNTVPIEDRRANASQPTHVFLGVDGISRQAFDLAREEGAFAGWHAADWISVFPAVSDYAWTRILAADPMPGYETQYYDPEANKLHNKGLAGVAEHPFSQGLLDPLSCWNSFDYLGNGELWTVKGYLDPEASLPPTATEMFRVLERLGRTQPVALAYLMNVDVVSHSGGLQKAVAMLVELDHQIAAFQKRHPGRFTFTMFGDHGNAHKQAELVDPNQLLREVGVASVDRLDDVTNLQAIPIVHVRVNFVSVHTHADMAAEVARRSSTHRWVDLAAVNLGDGHYAVYKNGKALTFSRQADGAYLITDPRAWDRLLGSDLMALCQASLCENNELSMDDERSFALTHNSRYPDPFHRIATAFTDAAARNPPEVILSMPDEVSSFGFHLPGGSDHAAIDGFHGALTRGSSLSVMASQAHELPEALRAETLLTLFPELREHLQQQRSEAAAPTRSPAKGD
ncbi:MAG: hypothetical protein SF187_07560 [Deltaproteobacteria bacterium]|nr:hypothetical protein [Deltaproteobacteria bacterium]